MDAMKTKSIKWSGEQVSEPGIYDSMPISVYHHPHVCAGDRPVAPEFQSELTTYGPSISSSGLRQIYGRDKSAKHFYDKWPGNPAFQADPEADGKKRHFVLGRATHHLFLGEHNFAKLFKARPAEYPDRDTGELKRWNDNAAYCKAWNRACVAEGRSWLTPKEIDQIRAMAHSISNHPLVQAGALNGQIERSIFWKDEETGIWLKSRPDAIPSDSADFADLKNIYDIFAVNKAITQHAYYRQVALTREACEQVLKTKWESFTLIFVEAKSPWHTRDVRCYEKDIKLGMDENRAALRIFAKCMETGEWPGPGDNNIGNERVGLSQDERDRAKQRLKYEAGMDPSEEY